MRLKDVLDDATATVTGGPDWAEIEIAGLTADSRQVRPGDLFAALPGARADGRRFVADAIARGAAAVLGPPGTAAAIPPDAVPVPVIEDDNPRRRLALMAARFFGRQPDTVVAVTGTNGKTSVAAFARQLWTRLGTPAASLGTLGVSAPGLERPGSLTTPDPVALHRTLAELADAGVGHLALEASSHGLDQHRLDGVRVRAAAFTNLSRDHLDYHADAAAYLAAKARLFAELLADDGAAVLNADVPEFQGLRAICRRRGLRVLSYGRAGDDLRLEAALPRADGQSLDLRILGAPVRVDLPLAGRFQAENALAALGLVLAGGANVDAAVAGLARLEGVPGRLERVAAHNGAGIYVDYAHTPDALATVLDALRPHTGGRLVVVFGCGGDRDPGKRPEMGAVAARHADAAIVTDDNPRSEDPAAIRRAILAACPGATEIGDRRAAIAAAVDGLRPGDIAVVAGKGHETGQIVGERVLPFDDREAVRAAVGDAGGGETDG